MNSDHSDRCEDVRVTGVLNGDHANAVETADAGAELDVVAVPMENLGATEDSEVLKLGLTDRGAVVGNDHKFGGAGTELLEGELVADLVLTRLDGELELLSEVIGHVGNLSHVET
jgi:hypothetical protein